MNDELALKRKNILINRSTIITVVFLIVAVPLIFLKWGINRDYENRKYILQDKLPVLNTGSIKILPGDWEYFGTGETDYRGQSSGGGYMVNMYGITYKAGAYWVLARTIDDRADWDFVDPKRIREEKGSCFKIKQLPAYNVEMLLNFPKGGMQTKGIMTHDFCKTARNSFRDTEKAWEWGALHMKRAIKSLKAKPLSKELEDAIKL